MRDKISISITTILLIIVIFAGSTFAYFSTLVKGQVNGVLVDSSGFGIIYNGGEHIGGQMKLSVDKSGGFNTTVDIGLTNNVNINVEADILLNIETISDNLKINGFKWESYRIDGNNEIKVQEGNFSNASNGDVIQVVSHYVLPTNPVRQTYFKIYLWIDGNDPSVDNSVGDGTASFSGFISAKTEKVTGVLDRYTVTFDPNGGTVPISSKQVVYGETYGDLPIPTREGYIFMGWNGKNKFNVNDVLTDCYIQYDTGIEKTYVDASKPWNCSDFIEIVSGENYIFNPNSTAGTSNTSHSVYDVNKQFIKSYNSGQQIMLMPSNAKYIRISYRRSNSSNIQLEEGTEATEWEPYYITSDTTVVQEKAHTLKAIWKLNKYTVAFDPNGGTMNSNTIATMYTSDYGTTVTMNNPTKLGYDFLGWVSDQKSNITSAGYWTYTDSVDPLTGNKLEYINVEDHTFNGYAGGTSFIANPTTISGSYVPSSNSKATTSLVNYTAEDPNPLNGINSTSFYRITRTSYNNASYSNGPSGNVKSFVNRDTRVTFIIVARFPVGWNIQITGNNGPRIKWLTSQAGTGTWQTYVVSAAPTISNGIMDVGHIYLRTTNYNANETNPSMDVAYIQGYYTSRQSNTESVNNFKIGATNETLTASWRAVDQTVKITPNSTNGSYKVTATNLFDKTDMIYPNEKIVQRKVAWNGASNQVTDGTHFISDWIRVVPSATYKITGVTEAGLVEWSTANNKNTNFYNAATQATSYSDNTNFTAPTSYLNTSETTVNATYKYMRFHAKTSDINNITLSMVDSSTYTTTQTLYFPNNANITIVATPSTGYTSTVAKSSGLGTFSASNFGDVSTATLSGISGAPSTTNLTITWTN